MTSRHSCGEDRKANEALGGITVIKTKLLDDVTPQLWHDVTPQLWSSANGMAEPADHL